MVFSDGGAQLLLDKLSDVTAEPTPEPAHEPAQQLQRCADAPEAIIVA